MKLLALLLITLICPSYSQVSVHVVPPGQHIAELGEDIAFTCIPFNGDAIGVEWVLNGSRLNVNNTLLNASTTLALGRGMLHLNNVSIDLNNTVVECEAMLISGRIPSIDNATIIIMQGLPSDVGTVNVTVNNSFITVTWAIDSSDVTFCISIQNSISTVLHSECDITEPEFRYPLPPRYWCDSYFVHLTPVNIIGNGTTTILHSQIETAPKVQNGLLIPLSPQNDETTIWQCYLTMSVGACIAEVIIMDLDTGKTIPISELEISEFLITFITDQLVHNRYYRITVHAINRAGPVSNSITTSTHNILDASILVVERDEAIFTVNHFGHSPARGALFSFVSITNSGDVDFNRSFFLPWDRNISHNHTLPFCLSSGHYRMFVYDIEHNGTLRTGVGYPAVTDYLYPLLDYNYRGQAEIENRCEVNVLGYSLNITAQLLDNNGQGQAEIENRCQVNVLEDLLIITAQCNNFGNIQVIVMQAFYGDVHKVHINQSTDLHTSVTIPVEKSGEYQVSIFAIREGIGILDSDLLHIERVTLTEVIKATSNDAVTPTTTPTTTNTTSTQSEGLNIIVGASIAFIVGVITGVISVGLFCMCKNRRHSKSLDLTDKKGIQRMPEGEDPTGETPPGPVDDRDSDSERCRDTGRQETSVEGDQSEITDGLRQENILTTSSGKEPKGPTGKTTRADVRDSIPEQQPKNTSEQETSFSEAGVHGQDDSHEENPPTARCEDASASSDKADCHPFMFSRELSQYAIHDVQKTERNPEDGPCSDIIELIDIVEGNFYSGRELYECICEKSIQLTDIERYCRDLTTICHKNIAKFVGFFIDKEKGYPVFVKDRLEINLENLLETKFENLPEKVLLFPLKLNIMLDTAKALKYLHHDYSKAPVVHGQVTAWNVYINGINGNSATAKLANLENYISRGIYPNHINRKSLQTIVYMPPEVTSDTDKIYTPAVDIFSFGHLTLYVITGKEPQLQSSHSVIRKSEVEKRKSDMNPMYDNFGHGHELVQLVEKCLCDKRNSRPIASELVQKLTQLSQNQELSRHQ